MSAAAARVAQPAGCAHARIQRTRPCPGCWLAGSGAGDRGSRTGCEREGVRCFRGPFVVIGKRLFVRHLSEKLFHTSRFKSKRLEMELRWNGRARSLQLHEIVVCLYAVSEPV